MYVVTGATGHTGDALKTPSWGSVSRVENRRSGFSLPVAIGVLSQVPPQSGLA